MKYGWSPGGHQGSPGGHADVRSLGDNQPASRGGKPYLLTLMLSGGTARGTWDIFLYWAYNNAIFGVFVFVFKG
jgi:hypothetical protein